MTPEQKKNMANQLADYSKGEMVDLAIKLQDVIDEHASEKRSLEASISAMSAQIPALQARIEEFEAGPPVDHDQIAELESQVERWKALCEAAQERCEKLQLLNEKYQEKLLNAV